MFAGLKQSKYFYLSFTIIMDTNLKGYPEFSSLETWVPYIYDNVQKIIV